MDEHTLKVLEFDKIRTLLSGYCLCSLGKELCQNLLPLTDEETIQEKQEVTTQLKEVLLFEERFPLSAVKDVRPSLERLKFEGASLEPKELLDLREVLSVSKSILIFMKSKQKKYDRLWRIIGAIRTEEEIMKAIDNAVDA